MDQVLAIQKVQAKLKKAIASNICENNEQVKELLKEVSNDLEVFLDRGIDFKIVVDSLDDSIFISDKDGKVLYVNPAYSQNTGVLQEEVLGRNVHDIVAEGKLFTGGATLDVIKNGKKAFRLSTTYKSDPPKVGYAVGVPVFNDSGELKQVVVSSRPILTLAALKEDFQRFLDEANAINERRKNVQIIEDEHTEHIQENLIGSSFHIKNIGDIIDKAAPTDATVLITGESGVGKEIVANEIYKKSLRRNKPFIKVNCASIPMNLLESELFGYEKGAFSGASANGKQGLFEMANKGTLLLDEIGDMPIDLQVKLLRAIQNKEIMRVGGTKPISLDIRFIAATNNNLKEKVSNGTFRQDLFYRLSVIPIHIAPLRERLSDMDRLVKHFVSMYCNKHKKNISFSEKQIDMMKLYDWPGNIRELENVVEYLIICSPDSSYVDTEMLKGILNISNQEKTPSINESLAESVEHFEKSRIEQALMNSKNLREAGKMLGVNASTVSRKIRQYGIHYPAAEKE